MGLLIGGEAVAAEFAGAFPPGFGLFVFELPIGFGGVEQFSGRVEPCAEVGCLARFGRKDEGFVDNDRRNVTRFWYNYKKLTLWTN